MGGVLRRLTRLGKKRKQAARVRRRFDLGEADVPRDNCENVIEIVGNSAGESAERLELARGQALFLNAFALGRVAEKNRDSAATGISVHLEPNFAGAVAGLEF